eukprot:GHVQ01000838.1.p1 GENE.GHVQ01000838.1~~GHVQ01000838.1.p1  ORF type:complete len:115 (+),score=15.98 GHVQ01000838.1:810-1154(+)
MDHMGESDAAVPCVMNDRSEGGERSCCGRDRWSCAVCCLASNQICFVIDNAVMQSLVGSGDRPVAHRTLGNMKATLTANVTPQDFGISLSIVPTWEYKYWLAISTVSVVAYYHS